MHILHILDHSIPLHSGYTFRTRSILREQRALGWKTSQITGPKHNQQCTTVNDIETIDGLQFYRTSPDIGILSKLPVLNQLAVVAALEKRLLEVARELKPDILHAHSPALNGLAALKVAKKLKIPLVYEIRAFWEDAAVDHGTSKEWGLRYRMSRAMETRVVKQADAVTTICEGLRNDIVARGISPDKVTVIPNAVDLEQFGNVSIKDNSLAKKLGIENRQIIAYIGSFYAYEGLPLLVNAMPVIREEYPDAVLLLVGGGPDETKIRSLCTQLKLGDDVIFTGRIQHSEINNYYSLVDIFVYPRYPMRLTELVTPLKPLEAMAQRKVVVASDVGGHKELIQNGVNGMLFKAGDVQSLVGAVKKLLSNNVACEVLRDAGAKYVAKERNWACSVNNYKSVYGRLVGKDV